MEILKGIPVCPGVAIAEAFVLDAESFVIPERFIQPERAEHEVEKFNNAIRAAVDEIKQITEKLVGGVGYEYAPIFQAHVQILEDKSFVDGVIYNIRNHRYSAEYAVSRALRKFAKAFLDMEDEYLSQRVSDVYDIEKRLLRILIGR